MSAGPTERKDFIRYPTNRVVGTIGDSDNARAAVGALLQAGFGGGDIDVLHGEEDLHRLDATGAEHGFLAQVQRTFIRTFDLEEFKRLTHHVEDIRAGRFVIMALAKRRVQRIMAADILHRHGAEFVGFYGRWAWEGLPAAPQTSPEAVPEFFARAWNDRDASALASLFDEDAEFVTATGLCWHDRESIRKAHATALAALDRTVLVIDETKVKLLSPGIAVVHARMSASGQAPAAAADQPAPNTTIISFVVHRTADRWLCASAHSTEVSAGAEPAAETADGFHPLDYQTGPVP